jgi:hypothetical protein
LKAIHWQRHLPFLVTLAALGFLAGLLLTTPGDEWISLVFYLFAIAVWGVLLYVAGIRPADPTFPLSLFLLALLLKLFGSTARYWTLVDLYDRVGDALRYYQEGQYLAGYFRQFDLSVFDHWSMVPGTAQITITNGLLYTLFPPSMLGSYLFFATLAFTGSVLFYRAFRLALPDEPPGWYRVGVFFLPSILFWPSSLGKEAWILFTSGMVAFGLVRFIRQARPSGLLLAALGLALTNLVRPHFAAFMVLSVAIALLLFYRPDSARKLGIWLLGVGLMATLGVVLLQSAAEFVGLGSLSQLSWEEVESVYNFRQMAATGGGSEFLPPVAFTLLGPIYALITVLFRPLPWEAHNAQAMVSALESTAWLVFFWYRRRVFWGRLQAMFRDPWLAFAAAYSAMMILALTVAGNFGILVRQRTNFLPFLWMFFA